MATMIIEPEAETEILSGPQTKKLKLSFESEVINNNENNIFVFVTLLNFMLPHRMIRNWSLTVEYMNIHLLQILTCRQYL